MQADTNDFNSVRNIRSACGLLHLLLWCGCCGRHFCEQVWSA